MPLEQNFNSDIFHLISGSGVNVPDFDPTQYQTTGDFIKLSITSNAGYSKGTFSSNKFNPEGLPQLNVYKDSSSEPFEIFVKPSEVLNNAGIFEGNYDLKFDFLRDYWFNYPVEYQSPKFIITEISPSRKEVRLILRSDEDVNPISFNSEENITYFQSILGDPNYVGDGSDGNFAYTYDWVFSWGSGQNSPIINYVFDYSTDPNNISLILRLNQELPSNVIKWTPAYVEREILTTQIENIFLIYNMNLMTVL